MKIPKPKCHPAHTTPQRLSPLVSREAGLSRFVLVLCGFCFFFNFFFSFFPRCSPGIHGRSCGSLAPALEVPWSTRPAPSAQAQGGAALRPLAPGKAVRVTRTVRSAADEEVGAPAGLAGRTNAPRGGAARGLPRADHRHHACRGRRALPTRGAEGSGGERRRGLPRDPWRRREARDTAARAERRGRGEKQGRRASPEAIGTLDTHCLHIARGPSGRGLRFQPTLPFARRPAWPPRPRASLLHSLVPGSAADPAVRRSKEPFRNPAPACPLGTILGPPPTVSSNCPPSPETPGPARASHRRTHICVLTVRAQLPVISGSDLSGSSAPSPPLDPGPQVGPCLAPASFLPHSHLLLSGGNLYLASAPLLPSPAAKDKVIQLS